MSRRRFEILRMLVKASPRLERSERLGRVTESGREGGIVYSSIGAVSTVKQLHYRTEEPDTKV